MHEDEGIVSVTISMLPETLGRDVIVFLKTMNGTAMGMFPELLQELHIQLETFRSFFSSLNTAGMDFPNTSLDLTFSPSSTTQTVMVPILNDAVTEDMLEYFSLVLMSTDPAVSLNPVIANITIIDDNDSKYYQMSTVNMFVWGSYKQWTRGPMTGDPRTGDPRTPQVPTVFSLGLCCNYNQLVSMF